MQPTSQYQTLHKAQKQSFDHVLTNRIGIGKAQSKLSFPLFILMFTEGCQSIAISLLLTQLQRQWNVSTLEKSLLITVIYIGLAFGDYVQMYADHTGRLTFIKWNAVLQIVFGLASCVSHNMTAFIIFRFFYGIGIGITIPLSGTYIAEITPMKFRTLYVAKSRIYWAIGCLITLFLAWYLMQQHHWRILLFIICLPGMYALYDIYQSGRQSLRYLWSKGNAQQVYQMTTYMCTLNQKPPIPKQEIQYLVSIKDQQHHQEQVSYKDLFKPKYRTMTFYLIIAWFSIAFIYHGLFLLFPIILARNHATSYHMRYISLIVISLFQISIYLFFQKILEHEYFGRKRTLQYNFLVVCIASAVLVMFGETNSYVLMGMFLVMRIAIGINILAVIPFTIEIFSTLIRSKAMGFFSLMGRIATISIGMVGINSLYWFGGNGLYYILIGLGLISSFSMSRMPYDTLGKELA